MWFPIMFGALLTLTAGANVFAQKQAPPEGGQPKDFSLSASSTFTLDNGLAATFIPYGRLPKVWVYVVIRSGNIDERPDQVWLADLTGTMMKEGTTTRTGEQIARDASRIGGTVTVQVGDDRTFVNGGALSEFGPDLVSLLGDIVCHPGFPASEISRLKNDQLRELSIERTNPQTLALEEFRKVLYPDHPYGRTFPTEEMIQSYSVDAVRSFYQQNFCAGRTHVYVAGVFDAGKMEEAIRKAFADWQRGTPPVVNIPSPSSKRMIYLVDRPGAPQSTIYLGLPVLDPSKPDYRAMLVTNALLGGSFASRITSNIREQKGYTYSPFSTVSPRYRDAYWLQVADVSTAVTGASLKEIFYEIDRLRTTPPAEEELKGIQNYLAGVFVLQNSSPEGIIGQISFLDLHNLPERYIKEAVKDIYAVTPEKVRSLTDEYIRPQDMTIVIVGDKQKIEKQVTPFGKIAG